MNEPIVIKLPLESFTTSLGRAERRRGIGSEDIRTLLKQGPVRFVVADIGMPLVWITEPECFAFWKSEVRPHVADTESAILDDFPGTYCYFASLWNDGGSPIVVLQKCH